jgi:hypothetical protein
MSEDVSILFLTLRVAALADLHSPGRRDGLAPGQADFSGTRSPGAATFLRSAADGGGLLR